MTIIVSIIAAVLILVLFCAALGIKSLLHKGDFKRPCTSQDPFTGETTGCACGKELSKHCKERSKHPYSPLQIPDDLGVKTSSEE